MIAETLDIRSDDIVIEIGPGHGELTRVLRTMNSEVEIIAVEKDLSLAERLKKDLKDNGVEISEGDALTLLPTLISKLKFRDRNYKIVGNIPYYITGHLFRIIGELDHKPTRSVFTVQNEVALRACAIPPRMNRLAASVQFWADIKIVKMLDKNDFTPPPKVASAIILLETRPAVTESIAYNAAVHALFAQPRKTIVNNLLAGTEQERKVLVSGLSGLGITENERPQALDIDHISLIAKMFFQNHHLGT